MSAHLVLCACLHPSNVQHEILIPLSRRAMAFRTGGDPEQGQVQIPPCEELWDMKGLSSKA